MMRLIIWIMQQETFNFLLSGPSYKSAPSRSLSKTDSTYSGLSFEGAQACLARCRPYRTESSGMKISNKIYLPLQILSTPQKGTSMSFFQSANNPEVRKYEVMRELGMELNSKLLDSLPRSFIQEAAKRLGLFQKNALAFQNEQELVVLMDYVIHHWVIQGKKVIDVYLEGHKDSLSPDYKEWFQAQGKSFFSIIQIKDVPGFAHVVVQDLIRDREFLLIDRSLSLSATADNMFVTNIVPFKDFFMSTGALIPVDKPELMNEIFKLLLKEKQQSQDPNHPKVNAEFVVNVIKACFGHDALSGIAYT